jgi:hypothetical protein
MKDGKFEKGEKVLASGNFMPECECEIVSEMPALEEGDIAIYYKVKPLLKGYRNTRPITDIVKAIPINN